MTIKPTTEPKKVKTKPAAKKSNAKYYFFAAFILVAIAGVYFA